MSELNCRKGSIWHEEPRKLSASDFLSQRKTITSPKTIIWVWPLVILAITILVAIFLGGCGQEAFAETLTASWYSVQSLKEEGTYVYSHGQMANGQFFTDSGASCASCDYPLGTRLMVTNLRNKKSVVVVVTDRTNKRFKGKRIDLAVSQFAKIADCKQGIIKVRVEAI